jgi:hypothetical protein
MPLSVERRHNGKNINAVIFQPGGILYRRPVNFRY